MSVTVLSLKTRDVRPVVSSHTGLRSTSRHFRPATPPDMRSADSSSQIWVASVITP